MNPGSVVNPRPRPIHPLELLESLGRGLVLGHSDDVESDRLGQWSALACGSANSSCRSTLALTNGDGVTLLDSEGGGAVGREVLVSLLVSSVFGDEVEVFSSDDDGVGHFGRVDDTSEDSASDRDVTGERALLVDVSAVDGLCRVSVSDCAVCRQ